MAGTEKDTDKVRTVRTLMDWIKLAKANPWVLVLVALGGGTGTQQLVAQLGERVEWWWVALGVAGYGMLQAMADSAKRQERMADQQEKTNERLLAIEVRLAAGAEKFGHIEDEVERLRHWQAEMVRARAAAAQSKGRASKPALRSQPGAE